MPLSRNSLGANHQVIMVFDSLNTSRLHSLLAYHMTYPVPPVPPLQGTSSSTYIENPSK